MANVNLILDKAKQQQDTTKQETATPNSGAGNAQVDAISSNLLAVQEAIAASTEKSVANIKRAEQSMQDANSATQVIQESITDITAASQTAALAADTASLKAQNHTIDVFEAGGGTENQMLLQQTLAEEQARLAELRDKKTDIMNDEFTGIGLIDNIVNGFRSVQVDAEIETVSAEVQGTANQIQQATAATESFARQNALTKKTLNEGVIAANQDKLAAQGALQASEAELQTLNSNARALTNLAQADRVHVDNLMSAYRLENEAENRAVQREKLGFQRESMTEQRKQWQESSEARKVALEQAQFNLQKSKDLTPTQKAAAELQLERAEKAFADTKATEDQLVVAVHRAQALSGVTVEDRETILWGLQQTGEQGDKYRRLQELGGVEDAVLGSTPAEAKETVRLIAPSGNIKQNKATSVLDTLDSLMEVKFSTPDATGAVPKRPRGKEDIAKAYNKVAEDYVASKTANIATGDASNPYHAPAFTVLEETADLKFDSLYKKVLAPMKMKETNPQTIVDAALAGVLAKTVSPEEAAKGITRVFELAALINNTQDGGFRRVGLPNQTNYNVSLKRNPSLFEELKFSAGAALTSTKGLGTIPTVPFKGIEAPVFTLQVDLMDEVKVKNTLVQMLSSVTPATTANKETK